MSVVVVHAHPCPESLVAAALGRTLAGLRCAGHEPHLIDLYASAYDPALPIPPADAAAVTAATSLVFVHPTWWTAHPAILLAWIDQAVDVGPANVRRLVTVTTLGGSRIGNLLAGESGRRVIDRAVRPRCALRPPHRRLALYGVDTSTAKQRAGFLDRVEARIGALVE